MTSSLLEERPSEVVDFLAHVLPDEMTGDRLLWMAKGPVKKSFWPSSVEEMARTAESHSGSANIYFGTHTRLEGSSLGPNQRGGAEQCCETRVLGLDLDVKGPNHASERLPETVEDALRLVSKMPLLPSCVVSTGGGLQVFWLLTEPVPSADVCEFMDRWGATWIAWGEEFGWSVDNVFDLAGAVLRVPCTLNMKNEVMARVVETHWEREYAFDDFEPYLRQLEPEQRKTLDQPLREKKNRAEGVLTGDLWMEETDWADLLQEVGATFLERHRDGEEMWSRPPLPGEPPHEETSATLYYKGSDVLKVFSNNWVPLEQNATYDKARFWVAYHPDDYAGDTLDEKVKSLFASLNQQKVAEEFETWFEQQAMAIRRSDDEAAARASAEEDASGDGWTPQSLWAAKNAGPPPPPDVLERADGEFMLYKGKLNYLYGQPGGGKSWVAQLATVQEATKGHKVLYLDFENDVFSFLDRMNDLGLVESHYDNIVYLNPDKPINLTDDNVDPVMVRRRNRFLALLRDGPYDLVVVDGVSNAMHLLGSDPLVHADAVAFEVTFLRVLIELTEKKAALVCIDHAPKGENPSIFGAQHKLAAVTGATYFLKIVNDFGRDMEGRARLEVKKDKPGYLRRLGLAQGYVGDLVIKSKGGRLEAFIAEPSLEDSGSFLPETLMENMSSLVMAKPGLYEDDYLELCTSEKYNWKKAALRKLLKDGYIRKDMGQGRFYSVRPFGMATGPQVQPDDLLRQRSAGDSVDRAMGRLSRLLPPDPDLPENPFKEGTHSHAQAEQLLSDPGFRQTMNYPSRPAPEAAVSSAVDVSSSPVDALGFLPESSEPALAGEGPSPVGFLLEEKVVVTKVDDEADDLLDDFQDHPEDLDEWGRW